VDEARLAAALSGLVGADLASDLAAEFVKIRQDYATKTLERGSPGKFVETLVQCLQHIDKGKHDAKPDVDDYLNTKTENTKLPDGLRICAARIGRSIYTLRNKRNISHKGQVDPNTIDLAYIHQGATWLVSEFIRNATGVTMEEAGALIALVQAPVGTLVEDIGDVRLVHADVSVRVELSDVVSMGAILASLKLRSPLSVRRRLSELVGEKLVHGDAKTGYKLTRPGFDAAAVETRKLVH
jgi:hypothetical protein